MKKILSLLILLISLSAVCQNPGSKKIMADVKKSTVTYSMSHPMHDWDGKSNAVKAVIVYNPTTKALENIAVSIKVATFDSQNANRDSHMIEILDAIKIPNVTFTSTSISQEGEKFKILGTLTFHGVSKPMSIIATRSIADNTMTFTGDFDTLLSSFNVEKPSLMGITTSDVIKLKYNLVFPM